MVANLIVRVVGDVLWHVAVEYLQSSNIVWRQASLDFFCVELQIDGGQPLRRRSTQFRILYPQVGLDLFQSTEERQNGDISLGNGRTVVSSLVERSHATGE